MKITVLTGSPRANSNSGYLAGEFVRGAESAGHSVFRFDAGRANIAPCRACNACRMDGPCVQRDDFWLVRDHLLESEAICLCTPMYYFGFSAQLKTLIDRFYSINGKLATPRKAVLIATYADNSPREICRHTKPKGPKRAAESASVSPLWRRSIQVWLIQAVSPSART